MDPTSRQQLEADLAQYRTRRQWIKRGSILVASTAAAPIIESLDLFGDGSVDADERAAMRLLQGPHSRFFAADAQLLETIAAVLGIISAIVTILEFFGVGRRSFSPTVQYQPAGNCANQFRVCELACQEQGLRSFNGVARSTVDENVLVLAAKEYDQASSGSAALVTQYREHPAVRLGGIEPPIIHAAATDARKRYQLDDTRVARRLAVIKTEIISVRDKRVSGDVRKLYTADGGHVLHSPTPAPGYPAGRMAVHVPGHTQPDNLPVTWLRWA